MSKNFLEKSTVAQNVQYICRTMWHAFHVKTMDTTKGHKKVFLIADSAFSFRVPEFLITSLLLTFYLKWAAWSGFQSFRFLESTYIEWSRFVVSNFVKDHSSLVPEDYHDGAPFTLVQMNFFFSRCRNKVCLLSMDAKADSDDRFRAQTITLLPPWPFIHWLGRLRRPKMSQPRKLRRFPSKRANAF